MLRYERKLKTRNIYLNQLIAFKDKEPVKVITGIRRCGKSSLLKLMQEYLLNSGVVGVRKIRFLKNSKLFCFRKVKKYFYFLPNFSDYCQN